MPSKIFSAAIVGVEAEPIEIETDVSNGLPSFTVVGLPDASVQEARERVRAALRNCGFAFPKTRLTINLAPADLRKEGPAFDLPIAVAVMVATGELPHERVRNAVFVGELALDGMLRPVGGALAAALMARQFGFSDVYVPEENASEAALVEGITAYGVPNLRRLFEHLKGVSPLLRSEAPSLLPLADGSAYDFAAIAGLESAKRALEIAAAGAHNALLSGSPGAGKTLLARALPSILPRLTRDEALEVTRIYGVARLLPRGTGAMTSRPWRAPHPPASAPAVIGGGSNPHPGEVTLAHRGVLFLDELPEFPRGVLESLRQPLEDREVTVSRAAGRLRFPAGFMLIAARNPCPCGYAGDPERACACTPSALEKYRKRLSGPLLDRIDLHLEVPRTSYERLSEAGSTEPSSKVRARVEAARTIQERRCRPHGLVANAEIPARLMRELCPVPSEAASLLREASRSLKLSARAIHRCLKVARTIADLAGRGEISAADVAEALQYRPRVE